MMEKSTDQMSDEENNPQPSTPQRDRFSPPDNACLLTGTPTMRLRTPSGGVIYHPFQGGLLSRLSGFTCSPGLFNTPPPKAQKEGTQPFAWSPETKAQLFPEDIDEYPASQFQLQERLNRHFDEEAQSSIDTFFHSQLVVPSPAESCTPHHVRRRVLSSFSGCPESDLPRSSSRIDGMTPTGKRGPSVEEADVAVQTTLSLPPAFDLLSLLPSEFSDTALAERSSPRPSASLCAACRGDAGAARLRRSLFVTSSDSGSEPPQSPEARGRLLKDIIPLMRDFNSSSPETVAGSAPRLNSSFEGRQSPSSPGISPIGSPDQTLHNETDCGKEDEEQEENGEVHADEETFHMDTGYQSHIVYD